MRWALEKRDYSVASCHWQLLKQLIFDLEQTRLVWQNRVGLFIKHPIDADCGLTILGQLALLVYLRSFELFNSSGQLTGLFAKPLH